MSLKLKALRKSKNLLKKEFAEKMQVDKRTIANWERKDGVIPSLKTMRDIANVLGASLFEIFSCFIYNPDQIVDDENESCKTFRWNDHKKDLRKHEMYREPSKPFELFKYIKNNRLTSEGFFVYQYSIFRFSHIFVHDLRPVDGNIDAWLSYNYKPSDGFIAEDENANCFVITEENILEWRIVSYENEIHTVFEITTATPFFPEMEQEILHNGKCIFYLDAYMDSKEAYLPYYKLTDFEFIKNTDNVIGIVIRKCREREGFTLQELSTKIRKKFMEPCSSKAISKWETGKLMPSAITLVNIFDFFDLSAEKVLDAYQHRYYANNIIEPYDQCFYQGLNLLFGNIADFETLLIFTRNYIFYNLSKYDESILLGHVESIQIEDDISEISIRDNQIIIELKEKGTILLSKENSSNINPVSIHLNDCFEFTCDVNTKGKRITLTLNLIMNIPKPKDIISNT